MPGVKSKKATAERAMRRAREVARKATANPFTPKAMREPTKPKLAITVFATGSTFYVFGVNTKSEGKLAFITARDEATACDAFRALFPDYTTTVIGDDVAEGRDGGCHPDVVAVAEIAEE